MSQIIQKLDQQQLKSLCGIVAHTSEGLTKSELTGQKQVRRSDLVVQACHEWRGREFWILLI